MLGIIEAALGNTKESEHWLHEASQRQPKGSSVLLKLGDVLIERGDTSMAEFAYRQALRIDPESVTAHNQLGSLLQKQGRFDEALANCSEVAKLAPTSWEAHTNLGNLLKEKGKYAEAEDAYRLALGLRPDIAEIHEGLGVALFVQQRFTEAIDALREAIRLQPDFAKAHYYLGEALGRLGRYENALAAYCDVIRLKPDHLNSWLNRAFLQTEMGLLEEALASYRQAKSLNPTSTTAGIGEAWILEKQGHFTKAYELLQPFINNEQTEVFAAVVLAELCRPLNRCDEAIAIMERVLDQNGPTLDHPQRATLHYELGRLYDRKNAFDTAFRHIKSANELKGKTMRFDVDEHSRHIDALIQTYNPDFLAHAPRPHNRSRRPIFIIGMPRSGTSVIEQILSSHPRVFGGGELMMMTNIVNELPALLGGLKTYPHCLNILTQAHVDHIAQRYLDFLMTLSPDAEHVTDKMPDNYQHLGLINILFPESRVIHCMRNPLDTCLSCYFQNFGPWIPYTQDLRTLGAVYREYQRLMKHWKSVLDIPIMDIKYEELIADQEGITRTMLSFCGLEWNDNCLNFFDSKRTIATASHDQVRQPIYTRSVDRWKNYETYLSPLKEILAQI